jgi:hypothetical protein
MLCALNANVERKTVHNRSDYLQEPDHKLLMYETVVRRLSSEQSGTNKNTREIYIYSCVCYIRSKKDAVRVMLTRI